MRIRRSGTALVAAAFCCWGSVYGQQKWEAGIAKVIPANNKVPGTAFIVSVGDGRAYLATASHVVEAGEPVQVEFRADALKAYKATVHRVEAGEARGFALLVVENPPRAVLALMPSTDSPQVGDPVVVPGYPAETAGIFFSPPSTIAGVAGQDLLLDRSTGPGFSGGPVLKGSSVVGVVYGLDPGPGRAVRWENLSGYLKGLQIAWEAPRARTPTILSFEVTPNEIATGGRATLRWAVEDARVVRIDPDLGEVANQGSRVVRPTEDTTYTLVASGSTESARASAPLIVKAPKVECLIDARPATWNWGGSADVFVDGDNVGTFQFGPYSSSTLSFDCEPGEHKVRLQIRPVNLPTMRCDVEVDFSQEVNRFVPYFVTYDGRTIHCTLRPV